MSEDRRPTAVTVTDAEPSWPAPRRPPDGAPNVVVIVLDDTGFAQLGCFGSDIETPNIDRLAAGGLRYTNFHTTALCSPTRACLLTGRNHHSVGMRFISNVDTGFSNCRGVIAPSAATMPEVLQSHGYGTFALGKWHLATLEDCSPAGPMDHWPLQRGFDRYYGFMGGATDQFCPEITIDNHPVEPRSRSDWDPADGEDDYHVSADLIDQAISMITAHQGSAPGNRFLAYVAFGATHSPHQAPRSYVEKYRGRYDDGWDAARERWFARQKELGIIPATAELSPRNPGVEPWDELPDDKRRLYARMQETFAGFLDHTDAQIGRLVQHLENLDLLDDTLLMLVSDNGASQEGGKHGTLNELAFFNQERISVETNLDRVDEIGGPNLYNNYPWGWAQAGNTPLRFYKQNTYEGGVRDPLIIHWPARITDAGGIRDQYHHVSDLWPTVMECVGIEAPDVYRGVAQQPVEGSSLAYTFPATAAGEPTRRQTQYYEMLGHRAIWHRGWKAVTMHRRGTPFAEDHWALYHTDVDFSECHDLSAEHPDKLRQLVDLWWAEAGRYNVLPLDDRGGAELLIIRRPGSEPPGNVQRFWPTSPHLERSKTPDIRNRSFTIRARVDRASGDDGVLVASGARTGGHVFFVDDNRLWFVYNRVGTMFEVTSDEQLPEGPLELSVRYDKTDEHTGVATLAVASITADTVGSARTLGTGPIETLPYRQTMYGMDVGRDAGPTVSDRYQGPFCFTGDLHWVEYGLSDDRADLIEAAEHEMATQLAEQ